MKTGKLEKSMIYYLLIVLFCMNFMGKGSILCLICALFALLKVRNHLYIDRCGHLVLMFTLVAFIFSLIHYDFVEGIKSFNFFAMYVVGSSGYRQANNKIDFIKKSILAIFVGYSLYMLLTFAYNLDFDDGGYRIIQNVWTGELIAVTLIGLLSSVIIGYSFYSFFCQKNITSKILVLIVLVISIAVNIQTETRTPILLLPIVYFIMLFIWFKDKKKNGILRFFGAILFLILLAIFLLTFNVFGIYDKLLESDIFARFLREGLSTGRTAIFKEHLEYMFDYIWGGGKISAETGHLAHNFIQQGHDLYGIFATILLLLLTISIIRKILYWVRCKRQDNVEYLLLSMYIAMFIQMLLEPIFTGYPCFMFSFLLIHGITNGYIKKTSKLY